MRKALFLFQKSSKAANMAGSSGTIYEFADFRLIPEDNLLLRDGESVPLPPKAFSTLVLLLENNGHLVRKDELIEKIWADAFVEEAAVSRCVWTIRNALGEDSKSQRFIQTVPKRGYRFVADVTRKTNGAENDTAVQHASEAALLEQVKSIHPTLTRSGAHAVVSLAEWQGLIDHLDAPQQLASHDGNGGSASEVMQVVEPAVTDDRPANEPAGPGTWKGYAVLAIALFAVGTLVLYLTSTGPAVFGASTGNRIAVLPLKPIDAASRSNIHEIGVADALIHRLNSVNGFIVRPLSATRKYDAIDQDALAAGREQKVDYVLASTYQIADGKIRVTSELYDVASGTVRDTYRSEKDAVNVFGAQDAIAADLCNRLMAQFSATLTGRPSTRGTSNEEAYRHYQQAQYLLAQTRRKGIESLQKAVAADPNYGRAWAALAYAYTGTFDGAVASASEKEEAYVNSIDAANKALALEPGLSEAYSALCMNKMQYERNAAGAEDVCKRSVDLDPNSATAHAVYAIFLSTRGRHDEAIAEIKTAMELEPGSYYPRRWHANFLYWARRYDETIFEVKRLLEVNKDDISRHRWLMWSYELQGKYPEAFEALLGLLAAYKKDENAIQTYRNVYQTSGWPGVLAELERDDGGLRFNSYRRAGMSARLGNKDKAFEYLADAYTNRLWELAFLQVDPMLDTLRDDPRYTELLKRIETQ